MKSLFQIIHIIGAAQGLFIFFLLVTRRQNKMANKILALLVFLLSVNLAIPFFHLNTGVKYDFYRNARMDMFILFYGPLITYYTLFLTGFRKKICWKDCFHLGPALALLIISVLSYGDSSGVLGFFRAENSPVALKVWYLIHSNALIHLLTYMVYGLCHVHQYKQRLPSYFSQKGKIYLLWLRLILLGVILICLMAILNFIVNLFTEPDGIFQLAVAAAVVVLVYVAGYFTYRQPDILEALDDINELSKEEDKNVELNIGKNLTVSRDERIRYEKNRFDRAEEKRNLKILLEYVSDQKPYLDPELNLGRLSKGVKIPPHQLTMLLSIYIRQNFYTFINNYRIKEAKKMLVADDYQEKNILSIAYDSGFSSKATFNRVFKQLVGVTPSQYRKNYFQ